MKLAKTQQELLIEIYHSDTRYVNPTHPNVQKLVKNRLIRIGNDNRSVTITPAGSKLAAELKAQKQQ